MTYWALNAIFLGGVLVVALGAVLAKRTPRWRVVAIVAGAVLVLTAIFDNVMIGVGLVGYAPAAISGVFVGVAPVEDFAYAVAAAVLLPSVWSLLARKPRDA
ncbi:MAG: lycopene cyclase domain-containing protein [Pseudolysinimonas sp.]